MISRAQLATWLALGGMSYGICFSLLRQFGELPLLVSLVLCTAACVVAGKRIFADGYLWFALFASVILVLSLLSVMPAGWTQFRDQSAAFRHWMFVPALPILIASAVIVVESLYPIVERHALTVLILLFLVTRVFLFFSPEVPKTAPLRDVYLIYTFSNENAYLTGLFVIWFFNNRRHPVLDALVIFLAFLCSSSSQSQLFCLTLFFVRFSKNPPAAAIFFSVCVLAYIVIATFFIKQLGVSDTNSAVRAIMWRDTWLAIQQTWGIGVGYGTEYITNHFGEITRPDWIISTRPGDRLFIGTHSAFYDVLLRNGVAGFALFAYWFFGSLRGATQGWGRRRISAAIALVIVITCAVNVGVSSISFIYGVAFCFALLRYYRNREAELPDHAARRVADAVPRGAITFA